MNSKISSASLVSLDMYDFPEIHDAVSNWTQGLAKAYHSIGLEEFPKEARQNFQGMQIWLDPNLLLSQTCGYPLVTRLRDQVRLVATPAYNASGCKGAFYSSPIIVRQSESGDSLAEFKDRIFAYNAVDSQSGYNGISYKIAHLKVERPFFSSSCETGSHQKSIEAIAEDKADIASIDCVTWSLIERCTPALTRPMKIIGWTKSVPGLPLITRGSASDELLEKLRQGLFMALEDPSLRTTRQSLLIDGAEILNFSDYQPIADMHRYLKKHGDGIGA